MIRVGGLLPVFRSRRTRFSIVVDLVSKGVLYKKKYHLIMNFLKLEIRNCYRSFIYSFSCCSPNISGFIEVNGILMKFDVRKDFVLSEKNFDKYFIQFPLILLIIITF